VKSENVPLLVNSREHVPAAKDHTAMPTIREYHKQQVEATLRSIQKLNVAPASGASSSQALPMSKQGRRKGADVKEK